MSSTLSNQERPNKPKCGGGGGGGLRGSSLCTAVHRRQAQLWRSDGIFKLYLTYGNDDQKQYYGFPPTFSAKNLSYTVQRA